MDETAEQMVVDLCEHLVNRLPEVEPNWLDKTGVHGHSYVQSLNILQALGRYTSADVANRLQIAGDLGRYGQSPGNLDPRQ